MKFHNKTMMLTVIVSLLCGALSIAESADATRSKNEILPVPWDKINKAMLKPSNNAFRRSSFIIEDLVLEPLPDGFTDGKVSFQYQALASLMGFQSARHLRGGIFNFFEAPEELLRDYRGTEIDQVKARFESFRKEAAETFARLYPDQETAPTVRQLMACWLYRLDPASPSNAMNLCQEKLFLERRRCVPLKSRAAEAKLILMQGIPLLAVDANGNGRFVTGFYETKDRTYFVVLDCADIRDTSLFSFVKKDAKARDLAKVMEWQEGWTILYVPWMTIGYYKAERMQGIMPFEE